MWSAKPPTASASVSPTNASRTFRCSYVDISEDGSTIAFAGFANETYKGKQVVTAHVWVLDAQTGKELFVKDLGPSVKPVAGGAQLSADGSVLAYTNVPTVYVIDTKSGNIIQTIPMPYEGATEAVVSPNGQFLALMDVDAADLFAWNTSTNQFEQTLTLTPPATNEVRYRVQQRKANVSTAASPFVSAGYAAAPFAQPSLPPSFGSVFVSFAEHELVSDRNLHVGLRWHQLWRLCVD